MNPVCKPLCDVHLQKIGFVLPLLQVRRDNFIAVCPNKVRGTKNINITWNYSESAGSAVAAVLEAEVKSDK